MKFLVLTLYLQHSPLELPLECTDERRVTGDFEKEELAKSEKRFDSLKTGSSFSSAPEPQIPVTNLDQGGACNKSSSLESGKSSELIYSSKAQANSTKKHSAILRPFLRKKTKVSSFFLMLINTS